MYSVTCPVTECRGSQLHVPSITQPPAFQSVFHSACSQVVNRRSSFLFRQERWHLRWTLQESPHPTSAQALITHSLTAHSSCALRPGGSPAPTREVWLGSTALRARPGAPLAEPLRRSAVPELRAHFWADCCRFYAPILMASEPQLAPVVVCCVYTVAAELGESLR